MERMNQLRDLRMLGGLGLRGSDQEVHTGRGRGRWTAGR